MAKLKPSHNEISLFPVFNILVCLLGILIFIMSASVIISVGLERSVVVNMDSSSKNTIDKTPYFVEWYGNQVVIHPSIDTLKFNKKIDSFEDISGQNSNPIFKSFIEKIRQNRNTDYLVFLVRPSGFNNFFYLKKYIIDKKIDLGYEAVDQNMEINVKMN